MDRSCAPSLEGAIANALVDVLATSLDRGEIARGTDVARQLEELRGRSPDAVHAAEEERT